jgi:hypothetical protein
VDANIPQPGVADSLGHATFVELLRDLEQRAATAQAAGLPGVDLGAYCLEFTRAVSQQTGRPTITYLTNLANPGSPGNPGQIHLSDKTIFADLIDSIPSDQPNLDLVIHSPGGIAEAADMLVKILRARFTHIRALVPNYAKSASTMLCMACDEIWMDERSELGPIDPQVPVPLRNMMRYVPAQAILSGFAAARKEIEAGSAGTLRAFLPLLEQYDLALFEVCKNAQELSEDLVTDYLAQAMLRGGFPRRGARARARRIAKQLGDAKLHKSHGRAITLADLQALGVPGVRDLCTAPDLRTQLWRLYCAHEIMFDRQPDISKAFTSSAGVVIFKQAPQGLRPPTQSSVDSPGQLTLG